jgi:hypothetical protein
MLEPEKLLPEDHKRLGMAYNNQTWKLIEDKYRTPEQTEEMVRLAYASCFHWSHGGTELNVVRGDYLIARALIVANRPEAALHHARRCLDGAQRLELSGFDRAYAFEIVARATACAGQLDEARRYYDLAERYGTEIDDPEDRKIFDADFAVGPWFGLI